MPAKSLFNTKRPVKPLFGALIVLAGGLVLSLLLWQHAGRQARLNAETQIDQASGRVESELLQRLNEYQTILLGMQGFYVASQDVGRSEFSQYADNLRMQDRLGGIRALSFTRRVAAADKAAFVAAVRGDRSLDPRGYPDFAIHPDGERAEYFVIEYIEPIADNRRAFGLDAGSQEANRASFLAARDGGETRLTPPFQIVQSRPGELGLVMRRPVYRNGMPTQTPDQRRTALLGFVGITLDAGKQLGSISDAPALAGLRITLRDIGPAGMPAGEAALAQTVAEGGEDIAPLMRRMRTIDASGRQWQIELAAGEAWLAARPGRSQPHVFLAAGGTVSLLLATLYFVLASGRASALQLARNMTRNLRQSEERFRSLTELSADWYWEQDAQFRFTHMSIGVFNTSGVDSISTFGKTRWELPIEGVGADGWAAHRAQLARHEPFRDFTYQMRTPDRGLRWFSISGRPVFDAEGRFCGYRGTGRDITERVDSDTRLREQADLLHAVFDHINQGISVVGGELRLLGCNRRFLELLGFPGEYGAEGTPFETFVRYNAQRGEYGPGELETLVRERMDLARRFLPHRFKRTRPDGTVLEIIGTPLPGGGMVTTYSDITEQERARETVLRERDARQRIIESIPGVFYLFDAEGRYLLWNRNLEIASGRSAEEIKSLHPLDLFEGEDRALIEQRIGTVFATGSGTADALMLNKDGGRRPFHFTGQLIALEDGRPGLVGVGIDMTERQQVEDALARQTAVLQATLEAMDQGISVVDKDLRMTALNRRFCELLEFPADMALSGASFADFCRFNAERGEYGPCDVEEKVREMVERARHVTPHCFRRRRPNGRTVEVRGNPLPGGGFVTTYTDVTEQEQAQQAIRDLNEGLEQRVRERTAELEASNRELESFSYSVSHDLRAPLRALHGFSHLLGEEYAHALDDNGRHYLKRIQAASERMGLLIDDLLDLARISRQELKCVPVDLSHIADEIRQALVEQSAERKVAWRIAPGLQARADPVLAKVLLENLLRNAWKFTAEQAQADIAFEALRQDGETVYRVRDNGAGFDMAYAGKLFQPFQRLHDAQRFEGTGIGLAIVHRVVRRHGGRIWAEGVPGQGAAFYFTLP
ncbi:MAG: Adaptive-response sensory-kinase SasA [Rhodocyclaceae bacterium]|nr:Adaptive-response sensory-kinase SasA [Rhodocyclaceae bacterium]